MRSFTAVHSVRAWQSRKDSTAHLLSVIVRPSLPDEVQQAVLAVLEEDRTLSGVWVDEVGVPAPERAAGLECESRLGHLYSGTGQASRRERGLGRSLTCSAKAQRTRHLHNQALVGTRRDAH